MVITLNGIEGSGELWLDIMRIICGDTPRKKYSSMCDLMCHRIPYTPKLGFWDRVFVDIQDRELDFPNEKLLNFVQMDAIDFLKQNTAHYDVAICSDGIEHLTPMDGRELLWWMQNQSDKQVVFTPLGEYMVGVGPSDSPDSHRSGWLPDMMPDYLSIVLPNFHSSLNVGAFFAVNCKDTIEYEAVEEKQRIFNEIKNKYVKKDQTD
jgi:hypothetical protein